MAIVFNPFTGTFDFTGTGGSATSPASPDTSVQFNDSGVFGGDSGLTYDNTLEYLNVGGFFGVSPNAAHLMNPSDVPEHPSVGMTLTKDLATNIYQPVFCIEATVHVTTDIAGGVAAPYFFDAFLDADGDVETFTAHDFTNYVDMATGTTLTNHYESIGNLIYSGPGTVLESWGYSSYTIIDETQVGNARQYYFWKPDLSSGGAITGDYYYMQGEDLTPLTVGGSKGLIDYASGTFRVDSAGVVKAGGYKSSDGTAGVTAADFKNGLYVGAGGGAPDFSPSFMLMGG